MRFFLLLLCAAVPFVGHAATIPSYSAGHVFDWAEVIPDAQERALEAKLKQYKAKTTNEIGMILVEDSTDYSRSFDGFLADVIAKGYTPNAMLVVVDIAGREVQVSPNARVEYADNWSDRNTEDVLSALTDGFGAGDFYSGLDAGAEVIMNVLPDDVAVLVAEDQQDALMTRRGWWIFVLVLVVILAVYAARKLYQQFQKKQALKHLSAFYNEGIPVHKADVEALLADFSDTPYAETIEEYNGILTTTEQVLTQFFEEQQQTLNEAQRLAQYTNELENELVALAQEPEETLKQIASAQEKVLALREKRDEILRTLNL